MDAPQVNKVKRWARIIGLGVVLAGLVGAVADLLLLYVPGLTTRPLDVALDLAPTRVLIGYVLGLAVIPLYSLGWGIIYLYLRKAAPIKAGTLFVLGILSTILGTVIHGVIAMLVMTWLRYAQTSMDVLNTILAFVPYVAPPFLALYVVGLVGSILFGVTIFYHATPFPRWSVLLTPSATQSLLLLLSLPFPVVRDLIVPTHQNLSMVLFIGAVVLLAWDARPALCRYEPLNDVTL